jgi:hypothetical protein
MTTLPLHILGVKATQQNEGVTVKWTAESEENNIDRYEVEKSADGTHFTRGGSVKAKENPGASSSYSWFDLLPFDGDNFYRIKSISKSGDIKYSGIARVRILKGTSSLNVYPNPLKGKLLSVILNDFAKGDYDINIFNGAGQKVFSGIITHVGGSATHPVRMFKNLPAGVYQMKVSSGNRTETISLLVQE